MARGRGDRNTLTRITLDEAGTSIMTAREVVKSGVIEITSLDKRK